MIKLAEIIETTKAMFLYAVDRESRPPKKTYKHRLEICSNCELVLMGIICSHCKCYLPIKANVADQQCPLNPPKWDAVEPIKKTESMKSNFGKCSGCK